MPSLDSLWFRVKLTEGTPPLYYLVTWLWAKVFGVGSDAALRATATAVTAATAAHSGPRTGARIGEAVSRRLAWPARAWRFGGTA